MARKSKGTPVTAPAAAPKIPAPVSTPAAPIAERSELKGSGTPKSPVAAPRSFTHEQISRRAYEIYANRGYTPGDPTADWHEAERQLRAGL